MAEMVSMELIKPSDPAPLHNTLLKPSLLDQFSPPFYIPLVFFYQNQSEPSDPSEKIRRLKRSLSIALAKFYPLAGRLNRPGDLSVECDDSGALFVEARFHATFSQALQNATLPEINQFLPFHPHKMEEKLFGTYSRNEILFAAKVCWFDCGSCAIGVCLLHAVGDVMCLASFVKSWADVSRSADNIAALQQPDFESGARLFPALEFFPPADDSDSVTSVKKMKNVSRRLLFNKEKIAELKLMAGLPNPTRVEVVTAFIWKHFINLERAKNQEGSEKIFIARHPVNVRSRISSMASSKELVFGNIAIVTSASFMLSGNEDEKGYHDLVLLTKAGLKKVDEDFVIDNVLGDPVSYVKSMTASGVEKQQEKVMVHECYFTSWNRFPMYEVDFGWGSPVLVTPAGSPASGAVAVLMGTLSGDGIEAWVGLKEDDIPFLPDEFTTLATTRIFPENRN